MRNSKHTILSVISIVMVGTLSFFQVSDLVAQSMEKDMKISTAAIIENIIIENTDAEEAETDEPTEQEIEQKSNPTSGYAMVIGTANLNSAPNDESEIIGTMSGADSLKVLESTEGWYRVSVNGTIGYVKKELVTLNKTEAETAAKQVDYYKRAVVTSSNGLIVRSAGSTQASSVGVVNHNDNVIIIDTQNDYIKILYGDDYAEGYVINSGLNCTGEWVAKSEVHAKIKKIAAEKAEAARKAAKARENARLAAMGYSSKETSTKTKSASSGSSVSGRGQAIVNSAKKYLGVPYVWGGTSPRGFDCSGLVQYVCRQNGISLPRVAASQRNAGRYVSRANLQPGDLVFFGNGGRINHVGIYVGNGNMIHAPQTGDVVKISSINSSYRVRRYAGAVRVW